MEQVLRALPAAFTVAVAASLAWRENGSVAAADWLPYGIFCAFLLVAVLASVQAVQPGRLALIGLAGLVGLASWTAVSIAWSPLPEDARNDALLVVVYAVAFATAVVSGRRGNSLVTLVVVVAGLGALAVAAEAKLMLAAHPANLYAAGRLFFPIGYWNAQAAIFLLGFWPAVALGARPSLSPVVRAAACGLAASFAAGSLLVQSKGAAVALIASAVVVLGVSRRRLRILVVGVLAAAPVAALYNPLTRPFRLDVGGASGAAFDDGIRSAGLTALALSAGVAVAGAAYAQLDRRLDLSEKIRRVGSVATAALLVAVIGGLGAGLATVDHPLAYLSSKWSSFTHMPERERASSHLFTLGSNRYDFWRTAAREFAAHPVAGIGQHGFAVAYLQQGHSGETPQRSHSVVLDQLSETGLIGFALLVLGVGAPLVAVARRARSSLLHAGILGAATYWLVHSCGDWIWTFPAVGLPLFVLLGAGATAWSPRRLATRPALSGAAVVAAVALLALMPPWLSSRYTAEAAAASPAQARRDLRWARRLDPLAVEPLLAQAAVAPTKAEAIAALRRAVRLEPRAVSNWYLLGCEELRAGQLRAARRALRIAHRLDPRDPLILRVLERARRAEAKA
jgi:hypothetical protein